MKLLDHGSIDLVESWGSDERIIESARMSTDKGFQGWGPKTCIRCAGGGTLWRGGGVELGGHEIECDTCDGKKEVPGDEKFLRFLWKHKHLTPFEMAGAIFEIQAPIFVFREWQRHRTQSFNELSARYTSIPDVNYLPGLDRVVGYDVFSTNKQARPLYPKLISNIGAQSWIGEVEDLYQRIQKIYEHGLIEGVPKELARIVLPVGRYSRMRASANLRNWLHFISLRSDPSAQWEIRVYSEAVRQCLRECFPRTMELFDEAH